MAGGFCEVEHTADRALQVWADTLAGLFEQAAAGMFTLMAGDLAGSEATRRHVITLEAGDPETALVAWLNELLYWRETRGELYARFGVTLADGLLHAWFAGAPGTPTQGVIKAATFHDLHLQPDAAGVWRAIIVFDA
jgi:SHS2 domain-containing protein